MSKSQILNTLEIFNSPNYKNFNKSKNNEKQLLSEFKHNKQKNIESYYSKKNLDKYLNNTFQDSSQNKKFMQTKQEKNQNNFAENRTHFLYMKYTNKSDERIENPINNEHQKKILESRHNFLIYLLNIFLKKFLLLVFKI